VIFSRCRQGVFHRGISMRRFSTAMLFFILGLPVPAQTLDVNPILTLQSNRLTLTWVTNDDTVGLQSSTNPASTNWVTLHNATLTNGLFTVNDPVSVGDNRFYRLVSPCAGTNAPAAVVYFTSGLGAQPPPATLITDFNAVLLMNVSDMQPTRAYVFDASKSFDPASCTNGTLLFHWVINTPTVDGFADAGITGYLTPALRVTKNSVVLGLHQFILEVTSTRPPFQVTRITMQVNVFKSSLSPETSTVCLGSTNSCPSCACTIAGALPTSEPY
jgi:hypothetical protein